MAKIRTQGPLSHRLTSLLTINRIALQTYARHAIGRRLEPSWNAEMEIGIRFWRHQFTRAMRQADIRTGRAIFNSLQTETDDIYDVTVKKCRSPKGTWYRPRHITSPATLLYFHGGGYTFNGPVSARFAAMFAHHTGAQLFAPDYRLTPEHPHPAQAEDALAAWRYVTADIPEQSLVVMGDSAGGHMALMLLQTLKRTGLQQPALCIGLCPWTDIGARGDSLHDNDRYDLVQSWMALQFGQWLDPDETFGREALSPISHDYAGLAPLYLQAGGREILRDMICEFARDQQHNGADITLDLWDDMPHNFQAYDSFKSSSTQALLRIRQAIEGRVENSTALAPGENTLIAGSSRHVKRSGRHICPRKHKAERFMRGP
ncbi:MAG: alpha/beta hydrolase [Alphaproteobacteria bacterium]|nr:alpha/beta hydrolase [Alphaproteobacteria bacterium]